MKRSRRAISGLMGIAVAVVASDARATQHASSPEQRTLEISRSLHPIADEEWQTIAGERASEAYGIIKGDTLYDISQRLFGDAKYWPKIWAINNRSITNPHLIFPGNSISFMPGTGSALPAVAVTAQSEPQADGEPTQTDFRPTVLGRSQDWRNMPRQRWETQSSDLPPGVDSLGFDTRSKIRFKTASLSELPSVASAERLEIKGTVAASEVEREYLFVGDTVFVHSEQELAVGETYALTKEPNPIAATHSDRAGYSYRILGKVKITSIRDKLYMGTVINLNDVVGRGVYLIPFPERIPEPAIIAGDKTLDGTMIYDEEVLGTPRAAQQQWVYIDRGTEDGVKPGMVFRNYAHADPVTHQQITDTDILPVADFLVVFCTPRFSTARVLRGGSLLLNTLPVSLLTSISDLKHFESVKMKDAFGADSKRGAGDPEQATPPKEAPPPEIKALDEANPPSELEPIPSSPKENAPPGQPAPPTEGTPPPPESAPLDAAHGGEPALPAPPPEVAPMPDLPASPAAGGAPVQDLNP